MEQGTKKTYTVKHPGRFAAILAVAVGLILLALSWALFLGRIRRRTADLSAYTTLTRTGDTVTAVLDVESLLAELELPNPRLEPKAARNPAVKALMAMELTLSFTEEPDVVRVDVKADEGALRRRGVSLKEKSWVSSVKVLPRTAGIEETPLAATEVVRPQTVLADGYLTSLLDEEGKGLNLRPVCEKVHFERDRLAKEIFGNNYVTNKTHLWFIVYPEGSPRHNLYRAVYSLTETVAPEGRSIGSCFFTVDVVDLAYTADAGVTFAGTDVAICDTLHAAEDVSAFTEAGCTVTPLIGGSVRGESRPLFDYNGFVRFVGLPVSYPLPNGLMWSPTYDALEEDDVWRLIGTEERTMLELLAYAQAEINARHNYDFHGREQEPFHDYYAAFPWYAGDDPSAEKDMSLTEHRNLDLLREIMALLER